MFEHIRGLPSRIGVLTGLYVELTMPPHEAVKYISLRLIVKEDGQIEFDKSEGATLSSDP